MTLVRVCLVWLNSQSKAEKICGRFEEFLHRRSGVTSHYPHSNANELHRYTRISSTKSPLWQPINYQGQSYNQSIIKDSHTSGTTSISNIILKLNEISQFSRKDNANPTRCRRVTALWRLYQAAVMELDDGVGRVLRALKDLGLANHTLGQTHGVKSYILLPFVKCLRIHHLIMQSLIPTQKCCTRATTETCCPVMACSANSSCWRNLCGFLC